MTDDMMIPPPLHAAETIEEKAAQYDRWVEDDQRYLRQNLATTALEASAKLYSEDADELVENARVVYAWLTETIAKK